jgi:hypothetical protein
MFVSAIEGALHGFLDSSPPTLVMLTMVLLALPPNALVHELGHAGAALALRPGRVAVSVGSEQPLVVWDLGRMTIAVNPLVLPWRLGAACAYEAPETRAQAALIAFAGPAASMATCLLAWSALAFLGPGLLHAFLWGLTFVSLITTVVSLAPFSFNDAQGNRRGSDGAIILAALH